MLAEEGLEQVCTSCRHASATRAAVEAWGLEILALNPDERSNSLTAVLMPNGQGAMHCALKYWMGLICPLERIEQSCR